MATTAGVRTGRISFWAKMTIGMILFIVFGFAQFALRGFVPYRTVPALFHVHGVLMLSWLGLLCTQALLAGTAAGLRVHRQLGWASAGLAPVIVVLTSMTCLTALDLGLFPPFFTPPYFLALIHVGMALFAALVAAAIVRRAQAGWHKRLILGSTILLMDPALGRVLPMPLIMPWGEWLAMAIELAMAALIAQHDRRETGAVHPATGVVALAVIASHVIVELLALTPAWIAFAMPFRA
jgi:hypothetical protein